ncbi:acyltransferase [Frankia sp. Cj3]|uniref:acyltransferase family protein n=1 Tax=Frankia sp. Cj3 TaxID=2880976 RepID=UPI001EF595B7|nr:acyltransferase [Frankia sp. Cj3]
MPRQKTTKATIATEFNQNNGLHFVRFTFAMTIIIFHMWTLGGFGVIRFGKYDPGSLAVDGFFVISGFLITRSRVRTGSTARFIWHRALRILPAFWVSLIAVAFLFSPLAWYHVRGSLNGYLTVHPRGPIDYVLANSLIKIRFYDIAGTPSGVYFPPPNSSLPTSWNGSMWTLYWDALCYLGVAILGILGIIRKHPLIIVGITISTWASLIYCQLVEKFSIGPFNGEFIDGTNRFILLFLAGSVIFLYADKIPFSGTLAILCGATVIGAMFLKEPHLIIDFPLAYLCIWVSIRLPFRHFGMKHDFSYGLYIFSFPIQQLAAVYGVEKHGIVAYFALCLSGIILVAMLSWFGIERPALRLKNWAPPPLKVAQPIRQLFMPGRNHSEPDGTITTTEPRTEELTQRRESA